MKIAGVEVVKASPRRLQSALPTKVKNITYLPVVRDQLLASCGAYAPTYYYKTYQEAREHGWARPDPATHPERVMSPGFTFPITNNGNNNGANIFYVMQTICRYGCADWLTMPESGDYITYPNEAAWRNAIPRRGSSVLYFNLSTTAGLTTFKAHLAGGDLGVIAALLYHDTYDSYPAIGVGFDPASGVIYDNGTQLWDYHAFTIVGYDDNKTYTVGGVTRKGAFLAVNSWGQGWGVVDPDVGTGGFVWFSYDYIMTKRGDSVGGAYAMVDRIGYAPTELAVIDMNVQRRKLLTMSLYPGSPGNMLGASVEAFPGGGGMVPFYGRLVIDITEIAGLDPICYTLGLLDLSDYLDLTAGTPTGAINSLTIEKSGGKKLAAGPSVAEPFQIQAGVRAAIHAGPLLPSTCKLDGLTTMSLRAAWADWNRDGAPDPAFAGGNLSSCRMLNIYRAIEPNGWQLQALNAPNPTPQFNSTVLAWGDYDNDGFADLAAGGYIVTITGGVYNFAPTIKIYHNDQVGLFTDSGVALPAVTASGLAWGDYNNDGRLDLAFAGANASGQPVAKIWRNDGDGKFSDSKVSIPQLKDVALTWADMNNDGWLDLAVGEAILRNNGKAGTFTQVYTLGHGDVSAQAWGDYNNDGYLDLAYSRQSDFARTASLYRNNGNFGFSEILPGLKGVRQGALSWADVDNDGLLDLALSGYPTDDWTSKTTRLYQQRAGSVFRDSGADLAPVAAGSLAWADFDQDGAVDLLLTGHGLDVEGSPVFLGNTIVYHGQATRADGMNKPNTPPAAPTGLAAEWDSPQQMLRLKWNQSTDSITPAKALGYRLRVGSWPGGNNAVSAAAELTIAGPHPHMMLSATQPGRLLSGLKPGRYFWSVQAIDGALASSAWSAEQSFTLGASGLVTGDVNADGKIDVADAVQTILMARGSITPRPDLADLDGNGKVESADATVLSQKILGTAGAAYMTVAKRTIGPAGGTLDAAASGIKLIVPAQSFGASTELTLEMAANPSGPGMVPITWRVGGLPIDFTKPLKLQIRDLRPTTSTTPFVMLDIPGFAKSLGRLAHGHVKRQAARLAGGWIEVTLDARGALKPGALNELKTAYSQPAVGPLAGQPAGPRPSALPPGYSFTLDINLLSADQYILAGGHFRITAPVDYHKYMAAMATDLEDAFTYYTATLGFDLARRNWTEHPLEVTVMDLGVSDTGEPIAAYTVSSSSYDGIAMEVHQKIVSDRNLTRTTLAHEFMHVVQGIYDSRSGSERASSSPDLWLDEATAIYLESHFATVANHQPDLFRAYKLMIFDGYDQAESSDALIPRRYGYGAASIVNHMVQMNADNPAIIHSMYLKMRAGTKGLDALKTSIPDIPVNSWITGFFDAMAEEKIYPSMISSVVLRDEVAGELRTLALKNWTQRGGTLPEASLSDLAASLSYLMFDDPLLAVQPGDMLGFQLKTGNHPDHNLSVVAMERQGGINAFTKLGNATYDNDHKALRLVVPNASNYIKKSTWLIPIVTNVNFSEPWDTRQSSVVSYGVFRDYVDRAIVGHSHDLAHVYWMGEDVPWPTISQSGKFTAKDVTTLTENYQNRPDPNLIPNIKVFMWGDPLPVPFEFTALLGSAGSDTMSGDGRYRIVCTATGDMSYKIDKIRAWIEGSDLKMEAAQEGTWSNQCKTSLTLDAGHQMDFYFVRAKFPYNMKVYDTYNYNYLVSNNDAERIGSSFVMHLVRAGTSF